MANAVKKFKSWLRNFFGFSQRETNGFIVLVALMALALVAPALYNWFTPGYNPAADARLLDSLVAQLDSVPAAAPNQDPSIRHAPIAAGKLPEKPFDPNLLSAEQWQQLGLPKFLAERIKKYQAKGGMFRTKEDVARIYGFPEELYQKLYPLLDLPTRQELQANRSKLQLHEPEGSSGYSAGNSSPRYPAARRAPLQPFDINAADTTQLKRIRGIGSKRAEWIVKHRKRLGGFVSTRQLAEVWGLDSAVVDSLQKYAYVAPDFSPQKVYINRMTVDELGRHPYLNFKMARAIVAYREQHGPYTRPDDLRKVKLVTEEAIRQLTPYLAF